MLYIILKFFTTLFQKKQEVVPPSCPPSEPPVIKDAVYYEAKAREIGSKHGIDVEDYIATIRCESNFDPKAIHKNKNGTTDYGIIQANDYWYIGEGKPIPSVDVALNDPEFCLDVMAKQFEIGRANDWICHRKLKNK